MPARKAVIVCKNVFKNGENTTTKAEFTKMWAQLLSLQKTVRAVEENFEAEKIFETGEDFQTGEDLEAKKDFESGGNL